MRTLISIVVVLGFTGLVLAGYRDLRSRTQPSALPMFSATRELQHNRRLQASDLEAADKDSAGAASPASYVGKYFVGTAPRAEGCRVDRGEIADRPILVQHPGRVVSLISLKDQLELAGLLDADSRVALCADTCLEDVRVAFVWCAAADDCHAAVALDRTQHAALKALTGFRIFLQRT